MGGAGDPLTDAGAAYVFRALIGIGGIAELPEVAAPPLEAPDSSGSSTGLIAGIVAAIAAGTLALGGAAWYARRRWAR